MRLNFLSIKECTCNKIFKVFVVFRYWSFKLPSSMVKRTYRVPRFVHRILLAAATCSCTIYLYASSFSFLIFPFFCLIFLAFFQFRYCKISCTICMSKIKPTLLFYFPLILSFHFTDIIIKETSHLKSVTDCNVQWGGGGSGCGDGCGCGCGCWGGWHLPVRMRMMLMLMMMMIFSLESNQCCIGVSHDYSVGE